MGASYSVSLDKTWPKDIWPGAILVSKDSSIEPSQWYMPGKTAYACITLSEDNITGSCKCSVCNRHIDQFDNFCRICGAKIIGKQIKNRL